jgi:hypothetical protein
MTPAWAQRQEELLRDCIVTPDVFTHMMDRLGDFVVPVQSKNSCSLARVGPVRTSVSPAEKRYFNRY